MVATLEYVTSEFNQESEDKYNFRIVRVLKVKKLVSGLFSPLFPVPLCQLTLWDKSIYMKFSPI